jgi:hypothetical protein
MFNLAITFILKWFSSGLRVVFIFSPEGGGGTKALHSTGKLRTGSMWDRIGNLLKVGSG